jgi:hypothetical protein
MSHRRSMSLRRATLLALLLGAVVLILASAIPALAAESLPGPSPFAPDDAQALATATAAVPSGSSTAAVDGQTALNASTLPGAVTSVEAGITQQAAVGLAPLNDTGDGSTIASVPATRASCWANSAWHQWGTWPYQQKITDTTYWCADFGKHITYRTSTTTASGLLCGVSWRASALIGGGIGPGFTYFINRASANFTCQTTIPWIAIHTTHHLDTKRTDRGVTTEVGFG